MLNERSVERPSDERRGLVHRVFNSQQTVLDAFKVLCRVERIDCTRFSWVGPETATDFDPNDPETVVVLDVALGTLQSTFEFALRWIATVHPKVSYKRELFPSHALRLSSDERPLLEKGDGQDFCPWTLSWKRVKLDAHVETRPIDVAVPCAPGCALLFMAAQHPERIRVIDGAHRLGFWIPGLTYRSVDRYSWSKYPAVQMLYLCVDPADGTVLLSSAWWVFRREGIAIPSFAPEPLLNH